jgi:hypothetical protein
MRATPALLALLVLVATATPHDAAAHEGGSNGYAVIAVDGDRIRYTLTLWPATLPEPVAARLARARAGDPPGREELFGLVRDKVTLVARGRRCEAGTGSVAAAGGTESLTLAVEFTCTASVEVLEIRDDLFDVLGADYHTLARIDSGGRSVPLAFTPESREARVSLDGGPGRGVLSFVGLGVEHILTGWDHLLFLVVLLLRGGGWLSIAKIITAFTLAHSVTLALAALDVVALPDRLVEAVIALSIAVVAAENLVATPVVSRRWLVSFGFGLVHGFGFSSVLRELGLPAQGLLVSLLGFNVGVELGQALVVAVALPVLMAVRHSPWEGRVVWTSSAAVLLIGVALFVERAFL